MAMQAASTEALAETRVEAYAPERSLLVASLLSMSGGFLDAFTWLSLGVFASSQTGNVVFLGIDAQSGQWLRALHHLLPIVAFVLGAVVAARTRAALRCLVGEIVCLATAMLLLHRVPDQIVILVISFGVALQSASFRQVGRWKYLSVTASGNMLRAIDQFVAASDRDAARGGGAMVAICLMFLLGAAVGGCVTKWLGTWSLALPIALSVCVLWLCRHRSHQHWSRAIV
ncbi:MULTISPECIES: YoaK family protein [Bradyrhizobium]|uniref:Bll0287 protein n=1 Tax=Bradyrhizobium diazoefficiens (strain JCM 10833 / BCRC 13528 / IAM 13628 / NBRC 14792 / USDA 110) TaxID=224911 RepID=Q89XM1_BRADU|nr:YoaK family protein [Bradyrhizobium diazoefficiens]MBP1061054.1 uncharacterized membrane protein YoaK (UPF0700 family) [Bradyrhizobium japonicum]AND93378.1 hypothetical protein AAV28_40675 [Bradyrhizobium diazoefficiens USDA 110]AWO87379.1 DUF1275 domain-containing protein [Bradyrhizobium diazoefficiens]PDT60576.1 DUF1275 domain-containing protein [Bradyrhizobium diazoefficiens]QBP19249.1 DUF1275 domain-containing protein [Bradyrhizobium diazoefficiens]